MHRIRSAYIHVPFCAHRCGYCNFSILTGRPELVDRYLQALALEMNDLRIERQVETLYFGGGTPTQLPESRLEQLGRLALRWFHLSAGYEWTVEANPADIDSRRIDMLARLGVNRLSLGAQSFRAEKLANLERNHRAEHIYRAV